jgi:hypothetical protein
VPEHDGYAVETVQLCGGLADGEGLGGLLRRVRIFPGAVENGGLAEECFLIRVGFSG